MTSQGVLGTLVGRGDAEGSSSVKSPTQSAHALADWQDRRSNRLFCSRQESLRPYGGRGGSRFPHRPFHHGRFNVDVMDLPLQSSARKPPLAATHRKTTPLADTWSDLFGSQPDESPGDAELLAVIDGCQRITLLQDDWDGEGSVRYSQATLKRATDFLTNHWREARQKQGMRISVPRINPADHGSVDLFWSDASQKLLINFPAEADDPVTYYGQDLRGNTIGGEISGGTIRADLMTWVRQE